MVAGASRADVLPSDYGTQAFLRTRARFHLSYRLMVRTWQFASPDGGAQTTGWRIALAAFVGLDICLWVLLRRPERFGLKTRLAIDSFDIALWSLAPHPGGSGYAPAVWIGFPLAVDAGLRCHWRGLLVPVAALSVTAIARLAAGLPVLPFFFAWLVLGVACGVLLARYMERLQIRNEHEWSQRRSAENRRAFLAGQNAVAMGADSVIDAVEGVLPLLGRPEPGTVLFELADAWKYKLCRSTAGHAAYLGQVLAEWAAEHNRHPDLSSRVELSTPEGIGTTLVTGTQATVLRQVLSAADLRGGLNVRLENQDMVEGLPGGPIRLRIGSLLVDIPADSTRPPQPYDPGPAAFVIAAGLMLVNLTGLGALTALTAGLSGIVLSLLAAWWSHLRLRRLGVAARPSIMMAAVVVAIAYSAAASVGLLVPVNAAGLENYPGLVSLYLLALLGGMYRDDFGMLTRWLVIAGAGAALAVSWALHPVADHPGHLILTAALALPLLVSGFSLSRELKVAASRYREGLVADATQAETAAFRQGRASVLDLVRQAAEEAHERLRIVSDSLSPELADNARRRLEEVDRRLSRLVRPDASSSSMTTS